MSRMLDALRQLEGRQPAPAPKVAPTTIRRTPAVVPMPAHSTDALFGSPDIDTAWNSLVAVETLCAFDDTASFDPSPVVFSNDQLLTPTRFVPTRPVVEIATDRSQLYQELAAGLMANHPGPGQAFVLLAAVERLREDDFSSLALADALARRGVETLLADFSGSERGLPRQVVESVGLDTIASESATWEEVIHPTSTRGLSLVGGGPDAQRAAQRFGELRGRLPVQFQLVLLTGGTAQEGQTMLLAPHCDGVYLVVCLTSTRRTEALAAVESLRMAGADVLGTIVIAPQST